MSNELFSQHVDARNTTGYVERLALVLDVIETGFTGNDDMTAAELERMRRLTFFRVDELTLYNWQRESDGYHSRQYWALMNYWLAAWEQLYSGSGSDGWTMEEYYTRQSILIELLSARWLTDTEKEAARKLNYYDIRTNWREDLLNETAYFDIAADVYYRGGLQVCFDTWLKDGVDFWHVFPVVYDGFDWAGFRRNTGRPVD